MGKNLYINLNGADYTNGIRIYGDLDNYTNPIYSKSSFHVASDIATLTNVNVGSNSYFKAAALNGSNVESTKSNAFGLFNLNANSTDRVNINIRNKILIVNDGDYIELKFKYTAATYSTVFASNYYNTRSIDLNNQTRVKIYDENLTARNLVWNNGFVQNTWQTMRITKVNSAQTIGTLTGSSDAVLNDDIGTLTIDTLLALSQDSLAGSTRFFDGDLEYFEHNNNRVYFNSNAVTHGDSSLGADVQAISGASISTLFTSALPYVAPVVGTPIINRVNDYSSGDYTMIPLYGQSLSINTNAIPYRNPSQIADNFMFNGDLNSTPDADSYLVPLYKLNDTATATIDVIHKYGTYSNLVSCTPGEGGKTYDQLKQGTIYYNNLINNVTQLKRIADAEGVGVNVPAITLAHGEGDTQNNNWDYEANLKTWIANFNTDIKAITGQSNDIKLIIYQMATFTGYAKYAFIPNAQLAASNSDPNIVLVKSMYNGDYFATGNVHATTQLYALMGAKFGWYIQNSILQENEVSRFKVVSHTLDVPNRKSVIVMSVPVPPLQIDTTEVAAQSDGNYGFKLVQNYLDNGDNSTSKIIESHVGISSVIVSGVTITIHYDKNPLGTILTYGMRGDGWLDIDGGVVPGTIEFGRLLGSRGNIKDSQAAQLSITDDADVVQYTTLENWMPTFQIEIPNDVNTRDKINTQTAITSFNKYANPPVAPTVGGTLIIPEDINNSGFDLLGAPIERPALTSGYNWSDQTNHHLSTVVLDYVTGNGCTIQGWVKLESSAAPQSVAGDDASKITLDASGVMKVKFNGTNLVGTTNLTSSVGTWYRFAFRTLGTGTGEILLGTKTTSMASDVIGSVGIASTALQPFLIGNIDGLGSSDSNYSSQWSFHPFYLTNDEIENDRNATKTKV